MDSLVDDMKLKQWCKVHWQASFRKSLDSYNPLTYHDCCFSFSRRGYSRKYDHPEAYSTSILKMPSLKQLTSEDELHSWIRNKMQEHIKEGRTPVFPTVNTPHIETTLAREDGLQCSPKTPDSQFLRKRCFELSQEKVDIQKRVDQLTEDNLRLQASSKSWFEKYQALLREKEHSVLQTPTKRTKQSVSKDDLMNFY
mgnify:CR=1 FL=1